MLSKQSTRNSTAASALRLLGCYVELSARGTPSLDQSEPSHRIIIADQIRELAKRFDAAVACLLQAAGHSEEIDQYDTAEFSLENVIDRVRGDAEREEEDRREWESESRAIENRFRVDLRGV